MPLVCRLFPDCVLPGVPTHALTCDSEDGLDDYSASLLSATLKVNVALTDVNLSGNALGVEGANQLALGIQDAKCLRSVVLDGEHAFVTEVIFPS